MRQPRPIHTATAALLLTATTARAQTGDDLSNDRLNPTRVTLVAGNNVFFNTVAQSNTPDGDIDYFTVDTGPNLRIDAVELTFYEGNAVSFIGFEDGETLSHNPSNEQELFTAAALGFALVSETDIGNLLRPLVQGDVTLDRESEERTRLIPLDEPRFDLDGLGPGVYAFVFQETGFVPATYELDFQTSVIPEPTSALLAGVPAALLGLSRRRRSANA